MTGCCSVYFSLFSFCLIQRLDGKVEMFSSRAKSWYINKLIKLTIIKIKENIHE